MLISLFESLWTNLKADLVTFFQDYLPKMIVAALIMVAASFLASYAVSLVEKALKKSKADKSVTTLLKNFTRWTILGSGFVVALGLFVNVSTLITTLGLATFAITFAFQDVLKNLVSGIIILIQHPFNVGESVNISGFEGNVVSIATRMTEMECFDGRFVAIPNGNAISQPIINYSRSPRRRVELPIRLPYGTEMGILRDAILPAVKEVPGYLVDPAPMVNLDVMDELSIGLTVYFWVDINVLGSMLIVKDKGIEVITRALYEKGIAMPVSLQSVIKQASL
jgi:small conductance mechanosensitive channel